MVGCPGLNRQPQTYMQTGSVNWTELLKKKEKKKDEEEKEEE